MHAVMELAVSQVLRPIAAPKTIRSGDMVKDVLGVTVEQV